MIILEGKTIRYDNWRQKKMPVDGPSYLVGKTDEKVLTMFCSGTNYRCLWTGPEMEYKPSLKVESHLLYPCTIGINFAIKT